MNKFLKTIKNEIVLIFFTAFFFFQIIYVLNNPVENLYTLNLSLNALIMQAVSISLFMIFITIAIRINEIKISWTIFYITLLVYLTIFMLKVNIPIISLGLIFIIGVILFFIKGKTSKTFIKHTTITIAILSICKMVFMFFVRYRSNFVANIVNDYFYIDFFNYEKSNFILFGIIAVLIFSLLYLLLRKKLWENEDRIFKYILIFVILIGIVQVLYLTTIMVSRVLTFKIPTYDMGIFTQMFHNMDRGLGPVTTVERDGLLSHFKVHVSPIYYLMLPIFKIWPSAITLQVLQILIVASGTIPLYKIAKELKIKRSLAVLVIGLYLVLPSLNGSSMYDLHENCFLAPLLLWLFYAGLRNNKLLLVLFTALALAVKEDAGLYVVFIGLYFLFRKNENIRTKDKIFNLIVLIIIPIIVFFILISYLNNFGDGAMLNRYENLSAYENMGIIGILISFLQNFSYYISLIFKTNKVYYLIVVLGSMAFLPVLQKRWYNYFLICPLIIVNLLSDYQYQHFLIFQYNYGTSALLMVMLLLSINYFEEKTENKLKTNRNFKVLLLAAFIFSTVIVFNLDYNKSYAISDLKNIEKYEEIENALDKIPHDSKVLSQTFYTTYLSKNIFELYDLQYHNNLEVDEEIDYIVIPIELYIEKEILMKEKYLESGYKLSKFSNEYIEIYEKE
ncbi:DUF2079 domain-containing protein [Miniphocaeibacter halophilus]|uniref:DUF2079 domain-containing protein n=1 Tax=Miniphocaeibacter halophilus TaxID=2931922 RepID=A0AC61MUX1_9FIRM|nr:DUF2079 domain-containing protein [Miniphocaeibacter halophilus]QQK08504.1 DUF2079 domain-containing protein [Miniphocaeibacter halophilus]